MKSNRKILEIAAAGLFALLTAGASGCVPGSAAGGGTIPSATCADPSNCSSKAVFGGHLDCNDPNANSGRVNFTYRDAAANVNGRFTALLPTEVLGSPFTCGVAADPIGDGLLTASFVGTWTPRSGAPQPGFMILGINLTDRSVKVAGVALSDGYSNIQELTHGNIVIH